MSELTSLPCLTNRNLSNLSVLFLEKTVPLFQKRCVITAYSNRQVPLADPSMPVDSGMSVTNAIYVRSVSGPAAVSTVGAANFAINTALIL